MKTTDLLKGVASVQICLADFLDKTEGGVKIVANFTGATISTVKRWRDSVAEGERFIRLIALLKLAGYSVAEMENIDPLFSTIAQYISLDIVSVDEVAVKIGAGDPKRIFEYIRGNNGISAERAAKLSGIIEEKKSEFAEKKAAAEKLLKPAAIQVGNEPRTPGLISDFASACETVRTLGKKLLSADRNVRFDMRAQIGNGKEPLLHTTWEVLNKLLAERGEVKP